MAGVDVNEFLKANPGFVEALEEAGFGGKTPGTHRLTIEECHHHAVPLLAELSRKSLNRTQQGQVLRKGLEILERSSK